MRVSPDSYYYTDMKKLTMTLLTLLTAIVTMAQGWPQNYGGVMLQGFYWDGYADSKWTVLEKQADDMSQYFDLIWIPQSGKTSEYYHTKRQTMGYDPCFWLRRWATIPASGLITTAAGVQRKN